MEVEVEPVENVDETTEDADAPGSVQDIDETDVDVERGIDAPEYVLYGGKGGVGKTTLAAATALASAREGTATLVVSTDPAHSLSDTLETDIPERPERIREEIPLYAAEIDPEAALADGPFDGSPLGDVLGEDVEEVLDGSIPGSDEAAAIRLLVEFFDDPRFDRVVVDTAPTGHTLRLLELPEILDSMVGKLLTFRERMSSLLSGMVGDDDPQGDVDSLRAFAGRVEQLRVVLCDPARTDFRVVMVPEELSVLETERLLDQLAAYDIPVGTVVVNRVMQDLSEVIDADSPADLDADREFVAPNHTDCAFCARRWQVQQRALERAQNIFRGHGVRRVPLFADEVRGERLLGVVAACLN